MAEARQSAHVEQRMGRINVALLRLRCLCINLDPVCSKRWIYDFSAHVHENRLRFPLRHVAVDTVVRDGSSPRREYPALLNLVTVQTALPIFGKSGLLSMHVVTCGTIHP